MHGETLIKKGRSGGRKMYTQLCRRGCRTVRKIYFMCPWRRMKTNMGEYMSPRVEDEHWRNWIYEIAKGPHLWSQWRAKGWCVSVALPLRLMWSLYPTAFPPCYVVGLYWALSIWFRCEDKSSGLSVFANGFDLSSTFLRVAPFPTVPPKLKKLLEDFW